jgi:DNA-binding NarL/FixJ family response regulator/signal transduction histidine kinase
MTTPAHHHRGHTHPHPCPTALSPEERLRLIGDLGRTLSTILDPQELLERVTELITHRFDYYYSFVLLCEDKDLVVRSGHGRDHAIDQRLLGLRLRIGEQGITGWAAAEGRTIIVPDVAKESRYVEFDPNVRSSIVVPLLGRDRLIGVLGAESDRLDDFDEVDAVMLETLAAQLAIVIENAELLQAERERARRLATVMDIARKVTSILDLHELLDQTTTLIAERFGYRNVAILLRDPEDEGWLVVAAVNPGGQYTPPGYRQRVGHGMVGWAAETGRTQLANDTLADPHFVQCQAFQTRAELDVPLKVGGRVLGVLGIESEQAGAFAEDEVPFLETLADQIAVAIENARLVERARALATSEERNRLAREIHDTLAQSLAAVVLELDAAQKPADAAPRTAAGGPRDPARLPPEQGKALLRARDLAHRALEETRHAIWSLRPVSLTRLPLAEALAAELASLERAGGVRNASFAVQGEPRALAPDVEAALFRIAQEALSNVGKHARAERARGVLTFAEHGVRLTIEDDGTGFDAGAGPATADGGFGLTSMRQRARLIGAEIEVETTPGWGTRVRLDVPDARPAAVAGPIRVLLADDHAVVREGLRRMLETIAGVLVVGEARDGEETLARAAELQPRVVLMDVQMPGVDGVEATRRLRAELPGVEVVMLSTTAPDDVVMESVRAGARGYLLKDANADDLREAIEAAAAGGSYFAPSIAAKLVGGVRRGGPAVERLTARELAVLRHLALGEPNKEIAANLRISENTVESHLRSVYAKLDVRSRTEALRRASEWGILAV